MMRFPIHLLFDLARLVRTPNAIAERPLLFTPRKHGKSLLSRRGQRNGKPHQGKRECLRRRIGGFSGVANLAQDWGVPRAVVEKRLDANHRDLRAEG